MQKIVTEIEILKNEMRVSQNEINMLEKQRLNVNNSEEMNDDLYSREMQCISDVETYKNKIKELKEILDRLIDL